MHLSEAQSIRLRRLLVRRQCVVSFEVNGTLFSLDPIGQRMQAAGLQQPGDLQLWFAQVLRDGISSNAGKFASFREIGSYHLQHMLQQRGLEAGLQQVEQILGGFDEAVAHDDVGPALKQIWAAGIKVATMTNGSVAITEGLLQRSGLGEHVCLKLDVAGPQKWKPAKEAYHYAVESLQLQGTPEQAGAFPDGVMLVAIHPWDCQGAKAAGLSAAYINRDGRPYPGFYLQPDLEASSMTDLARQLDTSA
eukprot:jgi/Astpho2/3228/Aster-x1134